MAEIKSTDVLIKPPINQFKLAFPTGRDSETFWDNGTEVPSLSRDKLKILPRDGTGRDSQIPGWDAGQNGTEQKRTGKQCSKTENDVLKQENDVQ